MPCFGVVVYLSLFVSSAYLAPVVTIKNSEHFSALKLEDSVTKNVELRRLEMEKSSDIFKKFIFYVNAHLSDERQAGDLRCETTKREKENFVFYDVKGKLFPRKNPVYVAETKSVVGFKKYFEIKPHDEIHFLRSHLKINECHNVSHNWFNELDSENIPVKKAQIAKSQPKSTNQLEETMAQMTTNFKIKKNFIKEVASRNESTAYHQQNVGINGSGYTQEFYENVSQSLRFTFDNENQMNNGNERNMNKDAINKVSVPYNLEAHSIKISHEPLIGQYEFESNPNISSKHNLTTYSNVSVDEIQNFKSNYSLKEFTTSFRNVDKKINYQNGILSSTHYPYSKPDQFTTSPMVTNSRKLNDPVDNILKDETTITFKESSIKDLNGSYAYFDLKQFDFVTEKKSQEYNLKPYGVIPISNISSKKAKDPSYLSHTNILSEIFNFSDSPIVTNKEKWNYSKESKSFTFSSFRSSLNSSTRFLNNLNISSKTNENTSPLVLDILSLSYLKSEPNGKVSSSPLHGFKSIKSTIQNGMNTVGYESIATEKSQVEKPTFAPNTLILNIHSQNDSVFKFLSKTTEKDLQKIIQSDKTDSNAIKYQSLVPTKNSYFVFSPSTEKTGGDYHLISENKTKLNTDHTSSLKTGYDWSIPSSSQTEGQDELSNTVTSPSLNNDNVDLETFYHKSFTSSSLRSNSAFTPIEFDKKKRSKETVNNSELEFSNVGLVSENLGSLIYKNNGSYSLMKSTGSWTNSYHDKRFSTIAKETNETYKDETANNSTSPSVVTFLNTFLNSEKYQDDSSESQTTPYINDSTAPSTNDAKQTYPSLQENVDTEIIGGLPTEKIYFTKSLSKLASDPLIGNANISLTNATSQQDENCELTKSIGNLSPTTSVHEKSTIISSGSVENKSFNFFLLPYTSPLPQNIRQFGFSDSIGDSNTYSRAVSFTINDNEMAVNNTENSSSAQGMYYSLVEQQHTPSFDNSGSAEVVNATSGKISFNYLLENETENFFQAVTSAEYELHDFLIENSTISISQSVGDINVENQTYGLRVSNKTSIPADITNIQSSAVSPFFSTSRKDNQTAAILVSPKGFISSSVLGISTTKANTMFSIADDAVNNGTEETKDFSITSSDIGINVTDKKTKFPPKKNNENFHNSYLTTIFQSNLNPEKTQTYIQKWDSLLLTTYKPYNSTTEQRSSKIIDKEIEYNYSNKTTIEIETTQRFGHFNTFSKQCDSKIIQNDFGRNSTTSNVADSTKNTNFTCSEKPTDRTENATLTHIEELEDTTFNTTPNITQNLITLKPDSNILDEKNNKSSINTTTTRYTIIPSDKKNENSITNENEFEFETNTQDYLTMPSFNNFTFLLPTTDYLTSYLPVRIHPLIVFNEIK